MASPSITVWRLVAHDKLPLDALRWIEQTGIIAIGWGRIGDLTKMPGRSQNSIAAAIRENYPRLANSGSGKVCLDDFLSRVSLGDLVIVSADGKRQIVMEVIGDYAFGKKTVPEHLGDYQHQRAATVVKINPNQLWREAGASTAPGHNIRWTLIECPVAIDQTVKDRLIADFISN